MGSVTPDQALVLLSGVWVYVIHLVLGHGFVGPARKKYNIPLPNLYESHDEKGQLKTPFNNYQRGHMNMVENLAVFYFLLFAASLFNPLHSAIAGFVWGFGRLVYGVAYGSAPQKRLIGEFFYVAELYLVYLVGAGAYGVLSAH